jgi:hypothetical protein
MTDDSSPDRAFRLNTRPLLVGGALMGVAGLVGLAGIVVAGTALAAAARDWAGRQEVPPPVSSGPGPRRPLPRARAPGGTARGSRSYSLDHPLTAGDRDRRNP